MAKEDVIELEGTVKEALPNVTVELSVYDLNRGRITYRFK